jgi:hypothetical protein
MTNLLVDAILTGNAKSIEDNLQYASICDEFNVTPLIWAIESRNRFAFDILLPLSILSHEDVRGMTAYDAAVEIGDDISACQLGDFSKWRAITKSNLTCPICLDNPCDTYISCLHCFCFWCIKKWHEKSRTCPICRDLQE